MDTQLVTVVQRVLRHGIELKRRLAQGETFHLRNEQDVFIRLLLTEEQARRLPEFGPDTTVSSTQDFQLPPLGTEMARSTEKGELFLGIRYALVCWLDEIFLVDSPWELIWNENKLENTFYGTNDRSWKFWTQARLAETRPGDGALWSFFLCVMLGFRGDFREDSSRLKAWVEAARGRLVRFDDAQADKVPAREIITNVPPLHGRANLRRMVVSCGLLMLVLVPVIAYFFVSYMDRTTPRGGLTQQDSTRPGYGKETTDPAKNP